MDGALLIGWLNYVVMNVFIRWESFYLLVFKIFLIFVIGIYADHLFALMENRNPLVVG